MFLRSRQGLSPPMLDRIVTASLWANVNYPQTIMGLNFCVGDVATRAVMQKKIDHDTLARAVVTPEQTAKIFKVAAKMHQRYAITSQLPDPETGLNNRNSPHSVASLTHEAVSDVMTATANYAQAVLPGSSILPGVSLGPSRTKSSRRTAAEIEIIGDLFSRSLVRRKLRPEAIALGRIWQAGAESLKEPLAERVSNTYREQLRALSAPDITRAAWEEGSYQIDYSSEVLFAIIRQGIVKKLPEIAEDSKVATDLRVVDFLLFATTGPISVPNAPQSEFSD